MDVKQLPLTVAPPGEPQAPTQPLWVEPELPAGMIGGIVSSRTNPREQDITRGVYTTDIMALIWDPIKGVFLPWFEIQLASKTGVQTVMMRSDLLYKFHIGDWVVVTESRTRRKVTLATKIAVTKVPRMPVTYKLDATWIGSQEQVLGEGQIASGLDGLSRTIIFKDGILKKHFGTVKPVARQIKLIPYEDASSLERSFYDVLELTRPTTDEEVNLAHRRKAKETHPDMNPGDEGASGRFQEIQEAYNFLKDAAKRAMYDMCLSMAKNSFDANSLFGDYLVGQQGDLWYPPISSGLLMGSGTVAGNTLIIETITKIEHVKKAHLTRVAVMKQGMATLYWTEEKL